MAAMANSLVCRSLPRHGIVPINIREGLRVLLISCSINNLTRRIGNEIHTYKGVMLAPSYNTMNLYGSEYWTYFFPKRVGRETAERVIDDTTPLSADKAQSIRLLDHVIGSDRTSFNDELPGFLKKLSMDGRMHEIITEKRKSRDNDWLRVIQKHCTRELKKNGGKFPFRGFLSAMHRFLYRDNFKLTKL